MTEARIVVGDAWSALASFPVRSVRTCVTSPPYFGLRDYGVDGQIGLEPTPDQYVSELVAVFREVRRVLCDDGTLWLNLGDSYATATATGPQGRAGLRAMRTFAAEGMAPRGDVAPKNLLGIPWRVAFALQADGWYLRQDIIWAKPNPMPESVTDRCTKSHEYVFLLSKSPRYYYDVAAIAEPSIYGAMDGRATPERPGYFAPGQTPQMRSRPRDRRAGAGRIAYDGKRVGQPGTGQEAFVSIDATRNRRDVWTVASQPFPGAHFAVMPEALAEPCVLAGSAEGDTVLDPFAGSGTVGVVALRHQRNFIGVELNPEYARMAAERIEGDAPLLNAVSVGAAGD